MCACPFRYRACAVTPPHTPQPHPPSRPAPRPYRGCILFPVFFCSGQSAGCAYLNCTGVRVRVMCVVCISTAQAIGGELTNQRLSIDYVATKQTEKKNKIPKSRTPEKKKQILCLSHTTTTDKTRRIAQNNDTRAHKRAFISKRLPTGTGKNNRVLAIMFLARGG